MKLSELEPMLIKRLENGNMSTDASYDEADGVMFTCPQCGSHQILCWRPRVPLDVQPGPGRWEFSGGKLENLTLVAGSSSVRLMGGCNAHFFVRNGEIIGCG